MNPYLFGFLLLELLIVSFVDLRIKKISNLWSIGNVLLFLILCLAGGRWPDLSHFLFPLGMIAAGFVLFLLHIMGAGDSKYLASLFLLIPTENQLLFFERLLLVTIFVGTILVLLKFTKKAAKIRAYLLTFYFRGLQQEIHSRFSYAPVILVSWILLGASLWK